MRSWNRREDDDDTLGEVGLGCLIENLDTESVERGNWNTKLGEERLSIIGCELEEIVWKEESWRKRNSCSLKWAFSAI